MAAGSNGYAKKGKAAKSSPNGHFDTRINGRVGQPRTRQARKVQQSSIAAATLSVLLRFGLWYTLVTVLWRCPSSTTDLTATSPRICNPYLSGKATVDPYLKPYYDSYLAPVVGKVQPYADRLNNELISPATSRWKQTYETYGAPQVTGARQFVSDRWDKAVLPQIQLVQSKAKVQYDATVAPSVDKVTVLASDYYRDAQRTWLGSSSERVRAGYRSAEPYVQTAYGYGHHFTFDTAVPFAERSIDYLLSILSKTIWPQLKILYGENVEPQLLRINQRLERYKSGKKIQAAVDSVESSYSQSSTADGGESDVTFASRATNEPTVGNANGNGPTVDDEDPEVAHAQVVITDDLRVWQEKYTTAADQAVDEIDKQLSSLGTSLIERQVRSLGDAYLTKLQTAGEAVIIDAKKVINHLVSGLPESPTEADIAASNDKVLEHILKSGGKIKEAGQGLRDWKERFDVLKAAEVNAVVSSAIEPVASLGDLALQEMGRKWAWLKGVTHFDWSKFHQLRKRFTDSEREINATPIEHAGLLKAQEAADQLEEKGMSAAERYAIELWRLKEVADWKFRAQDDSDDFSDHVLPASIAKVSSRASASIRSLKSAVTEHSSQGLAESVVSKASEHARKATSAASAAVSSAVSAASSVADAVTSISSPNEGKQERKQEKKVWGGVAAAQDVDERQIVLDDEHADWSASERLRSLLSGAGDQAEALTRVLSQAVVRPTKTKGTLESINSVANENYDKAFSVASSVLYGTSQGAVESLSSVADERYSQALEAASYALYGSPTPFAASVAAQASASYDTALKMAKDQYDLAKARVSEQVSGTPKPIHQKMYSSVEEAYSNAVAAAGQRYDAAASSIKTLNPMEAVSAVASSRLSEGLSLASVQYSNAKVALGATPTPAHQQYLGEAQRKYYEGIGQAHAKYSDFMTAASTAVYGAPTAAYAGYLSAAQSRYSAAISVASANLAQAAGKSSSTGYLEAASSRYDEYCSVASASAASASSQASVAFYGSSPGSWESFTSAAVGRADAVKQAASSAVYGTETPWAQSVVGQATQNWEALVAKASEQVYGTPTPYAESAYSRAGEYAAQVTDSAAAQYAAMQALVSELVMGKEPDFTDSVMLRFRSAYATGAGVAGDSAASASSYGSVMYGSAASMASSALSPAASALESVFDSANDGLNAVVEAASKQVYGTTKGSVEQASSRAASAYSAGQSRVSEAIYGRETGWVEAGQSSLAAVAASAQSAASAAVYGQEPGTYESVKRRMAAAVESASARLGELGAGSAEAVGEYASSAGEAVSSAAARVRDEL